MIKDEMLGDLQSFIACKFICENCNVCYVGETTRQFINRINEYLQRDIETTSCVYWVSTL